MYRFGETKERYKQSTYSHKYCRIIMTIKRSFVFKFSQAALLMNKLKIHAVLLLWRYNVYVHKVETTDFSFHLQLHFAVRRNGLRKLEELRIGLQHDLSSDTIMLLLQNTPDLRILGRTDWWTTMTHLEKVNLIRTLKLR